jgi:hypothetical protein
LYWLSYGHVPSQGINANQRVAAFFLIRHMDQNSLCWGAVLYMMSRFMCQGEFKPFFLFSYNPTPLAGTTKHEYNQMVEDISYKCLTGTGL